MSTNRTSERKNKRAKNFNKFSRRIEQALERLSARIARSKKPLDPAAVSRQIGRVFQQNQRAAARFAIALEPDACPAGFRLRVDHDASFDDWAALSEGAYLLRSNISDWSDRQLWKAYIQLTQAEAAFRIHKDQLNLRPIWHQREDRVQAHILVCFLAFVLFKEPRDVAGARGPRQLAADHPRRTGAHPVPRRRLAYRSARRDPVALRRTARRRPGGASRPPRRGLPQAHAPPKKRASDPRTQRLNPYLSAEM